MYNCQLLKCLKQKKHSMIISNVLQQFSLEITTVLNHVSNLKKICFLNLFNVSSISNKLFSEN